jgi:hypothetical protein
LLSIFWLILWVGSIYMIWLRLALVTGLVSSPLYGLYSSIRDKSTDDLKQEVGVSPRSVLRRDRRTVVLLSSVGGPIAGIVTCAYLGYAFRAGLIFAILAGIASWLAVWLTIPLGRHGEWGPYIISRGWLALLHFLPWRLMAFLEDAHSRGVLRQAGAVYQFQHIELQYRLCASRRGMPSHLEALAAWKDII